MFYEKAKICLDKLGQFTFTWNHPNDIDWDDFMKVLELPFHSVRCICPACNAYHFVMVRDGKEFKEDSKGLCPSCSHALADLVFLKVEEDRIGEWIKSGGKISPIDLIKKQATENDKKSW